MYTVERMANTSHPSRGAWIEIIPEGIARDAKTGRTPHGVRGLKYLDAIPSDETTGRTPHGVRGLKLTINGNATTALKSHPSRGAWIEIKVRIMLFKIRVVAPLTGCVD